MFGYLDTYLIYFKTLRGFEQEETLLKFTLLARKNFSTDYIFVIYCTVIFMSVILMDTVHLIYEIVVLINVLCN
jgi:hypothetical protein